MNDVIRHRERERCASTRTGPPTQLQRANWSEISVFTWLFFNDFDILLAMKTGMYNIKIVEKARKT